MDEWDELESRYKPKGNYKMHDENKNALLNNYVVPPFSVLDTKAGYWQDRKKQLFDYVGDSTKGRHVETISSNLIEMNSTSMFDPVLCEIIYKWYCPTNGKIIDCFAGGAVRGLMAYKFGYSYIGIDLSRKQIEENVKRAKQLRIKPNNGLVWKCDDSLNIDKYAEDGSFDLLFTCPPYFNLEVYSDDNRDISNMNIVEFEKTYKMILQKTVNKLKNNRFAVIVVGNVRNEDGVYIDLVGMTNKIMEQCGCGLYNDCVLLEALGSAPIRASRMFGSYRKQIHVHQNVLVYYKGVPNKKNLKKFMSLVEK